MSIYLINFQFAKSRNMRASVVYVPTCPCANVPKARQHLLFTWQRVNKRANLQIFHLGVPTWQFFRLACQCAKRRANFLIIFQYLKFSIMVNIWKFPEYLGNSRKFISRNKEFQFWYLLVLPYMLKTCFFYLSCKP